MGSQAIINVSEIAADIVPALRDALKDVDSDAVNEVLSKRPRLSWWEATRRRVRAELSKRLEMG